MQRQMKLSHLFEAALYAGDLGAAERFYRDVLGLELVSRSDGPGLAFGCGEAVLLVFDPERTRIADAGVPTHGAIGEGHVAFAIDETEIDPWRRHLESRGVEAGVEWPEERGRSLYFRDPSGNVVESAPPTLWKRKLREDRGAAA
jgi:catechol 2,3-dioxygenase-like lactoylglutathione lyase family enzyme